VDPGTPGDDLDSRVARAVASNSTPDDVASALRAHNDIADARARDGLVKTEPPLVELVIEQLEGEGAISTRVYDLRLDLDGTLHLRGSHGA
jgi:hypothetical protein